MLGFRARARTTTITCNDAELEDAQWFTRRQIRAGEPSLPPPLSISYRLIADWYDADSPRPLAEEPGAQRWELRR
jgi:NAD+ diphosphatase